MLQVDAGREHGPLGADAALVADALLAHDVMLAPGRLMVLARGLEGRGITAITSLVASGRPRGTVLATYPGPGAAVRAGQMVLLTSSGHRTGAGSTGR